MTAAEPWRFLDSNWILPEQLPRYRDLLDSIKLTDRSSPTDTIIATLRAFAFDDYDRSNLNQLISLMRMEAWHFPRSALPADFDRVLEGGEIEPSYFEAIFEKIKEHNRALGLPVTIGLKGLAKGALYRFEGLRGRNGPSLHSKEGGCPTRRGPDE